MPRTTCPCTVAYVEGRSVALDCGGDEPVVLSLAAECRITRDGAKVPLSSVNNGEAGEATYTQFGLVSLALETPAAEPAPRRRQAEARSTPSGPAPVTPAADVVPATAPRDVMFPGDAG